MVSNLHVSLKNNSIFIIAKAKPQRLTQLISLSFLVSSRCEIFLFIQLSFYRPTYSPRLDDPGALGDDYIIFTGLFNTSSTLYIGELLRASDQARKSQQIVSDTF